MKKNHIQSNPITISKNILVFEVEDFVSLANILISSSLSLRKCGVPCAFLDNVSKKGFEYRNIVKPLIKGRSWKNVKAKYPYLKVNIDEDEAKKLMIKLNSLIAHTSRIGTENTDNLASQLNIYYKTIQQSLDKFKRW